MTSSEEKFLKQTIKDLCSFIEVPRKVKFSQTKEENIVSTLVSVKLKTSDSFTEDNYENIAALQHLSRIILKKKIGKLVPFIVDVNEQRKRREEYLGKLANDTALKAISENKLLILKPMNSYERRIIHLTLASNEKVMTESLGEEGERRVVIKPKT